MCCSVAPLIQHTLGGGLAVHIEGDAGKFTFVNITCLWGIRGCTRTVVQEKLDTVHHEKYMMIYAQYIEMIAIY